MFNKINNVSYIVGGRLPSKEGLHMFKKKIITTMHIIYPHKIEGHNTCLPHSRNP